MTNEPVLIYAFDPLCGWCFGFHPVIEKLARRFSENLELTVIPGGLAIDENAQPIREGYSYIIDGLKRVEQTTGVTFGENFKLLAEEGSYLYDSGPSCIAQTVVNNLNPGFSLTFAGLLQKALFEHGKNLNDPTTFTELIDEHDSGIDPDKFLEAYQNEDTRRQTREQFEWCKKMGATAFPTLLLEVGSETGLLSRGFRPYEPIESHLHHLVRNFERLMQ